MSKTLIVYFSREGGNYVNGRIVNLDVGNTEIAAKMIQKLTGGEIFKIEPRYPYSNDYMICIDEAKKDLQADARPDLKSYPESIEEYDTIIIGYPNYWGTMPMHIFTFIEKYDFSGKVILPFCTHEGSGLGKSEKDLKKLCPNSIFRKGLAIHGGSVKNAENEIENRLNKADIIEGLRKVIREFE